VTVREFVATLRHDPRWAWTWTWWRFGEVTLHTTDRTWATRDPDISLPEGLVALGCSGRTRTDGLWDWVGFDVDVGHGKKAYHSTRVALLAAHRIRDQLGSCEIRLSRSGRGVHVRHAFGVPMPDGQAIARQYAAELRVMMDPAAVGRQMLTLWAREVPAVDGFRLIEPLGE
jgi:hypothetical protein